MQSVLTNKNKNLISIAQNFLLLLKLGFIYCASCSVRSVVYLCVCANRKVSLVSYQEAAGNCKFDVKIIQISYKTKDININVF